MSWLTPSRQWRSGPWTLQLRDDELADIAFHGRRVLRSIRAVVRDRDWATAPLIVGVVRETDTGVSFEVHTEALGSSFRGVVRVEARGAQLRVDLELASGAEFWTNRTGLVVLHPPHNAGAALRVTHTDGSVQQTAFPREISPHQPVLDIAALTWLDDRLEVSTVFEGDVFEMEDQRNWTDASYKTYSRPLSLPFPYRVGAGERVVQALTIRASESEEDSSGRGEDDDRIVLRPAGLFPAIGVGAATAPDPAPAFEPLGAEVLVELDLSTANWSAALARAASSGVPLDVRFIVEPEAYAPLTQAAVALRGLDVARVGVFDASGEARHVSPSAAVATLRRALAAAGVDAPVVGGSRSHFTELNRERGRLPADLDGLALTVTPLFHALGTEQLIESVAMQRLVVRQAVSYAEGIPVHIGPICLRPRYNDVATGALPAPTRADLAEGYGAEFTGLVDERQSAPELAAWTLASAAALAVDGVASLTYFEEWGPRGIRSSTGDPLPAHAALAALAALTGGALLTGDSPDGLVWALGATRDGASTVLVANLDRRTRTLVLETPSGRGEVIAEAFGTTTTIITGAQARKDHS